MKSPIVYFLGFLLFAGQGVQAEVSYKEKKHPHNVFSVNRVNTATYSTTYVPFTEWKSTLSGRFFQLEPAPVLRGAAEGILENAPATAVDPSQYEDQAAEFAALVNFRNEGGRPSANLQGKSAAAETEKRQQKTHVVETVMSALVNIPLSNIDLSPQALRQLPENIDYFHYHFQIPGSLVSLAVEDTHYSRKNLDPNKDYLLSVFDLREYGCAVMRNQIDDYFSKRAAKDRMANGSIYVISDIQLNAAADLEAVTNLLGKKPDALISQKVMYANHLVRASSQYFAFYQEGENTRIVMVSNVAMGSKFFQGTMGTIARQFLLDGIGTGLLGSALEAKDVLSGLLGDAEEDVSNKNSCDAGLALGLIGFSQSLFNEFHALIQE